MKHTVSAGRPPKERFCKKNIITALAVCVFTAFTLCFFSPAEMYAANPTEYLIGPADALIPLLITAAALSAVLVTVTAAFLALNETLSQVTIRLLLGFTLAGYVQMMFLNGRLAKFTGDAVRYDMSDPFIAADFVIYYLVFLLPLILYAAKRSKPEGRLSKLPAEKIISAVSAALIAMQTIGIVPGIISAADIMKERYTFSDYYLSYDPILSLSKENNVIVFLIDRLDGNWMQQAIDEYPELSGYLDGFTFYRNSVSQYVYTDPSVPQMLSGINPEDCGRHIDEETFWGSNAVLKPLHDNGLNVNVFIDRTLYKSLDDVASYGYIDNLSEQDIQYHINYIDEGGVVPKQMQFSFIKTMPYIIKPFFYTGISSEFANTFIVSETDVPTLSQVGIRSDLQFLNYVKEHGLNADSEKPVFDFVHLSGAHDISEELAMLYPKTAERGIFDEVTNIRGELEVLNYWFEEMKRLGIYDSSTIILTGDHGRPIKYSEVKAEALDDPILTGLLIKPAGAEHTPLVTDTETEMYNPYFSASVLEYAGLDHSALGTSYNDSITQGIHAERVIYPVDFGGQLGRPVDAGIYIITGNAMDFCNWKYVKF